jgi:hypothetical protein
MEHIPYCTAPAEHWGLLHVTRLASRRILIEKNIKKRTGPALSVFSPWGHTSRIGEEHWSLQKYLLYT